ncbi:MAG: helix-turn-helix domain-containing protein [Clostridia bacterium]|nr:helix-turn-helix domain-containing protein [Clostridia bacterium]
MTELEKIARSTAEKLGIRFEYYKENVRPEGIPVCDKQFEGIADDGSYTYFRFLYQNVGYIGVLQGVGQSERNYATLLPTYIESFAERFSELSKTEYLKRILLGECSSTGIYKYVTKFSVKDAACFALAIEVPKMVDESLALMEQYFGNSLDTALKMDANRCALVKYVDESGDEYRSSVDYAEFLARSLKEELGLDVLVGVGPTVNELKEVAGSYLCAENALRYADVFESRGNVHSYREFILARVLEDIPESKWAEYVAEFSDERFKEIFENEEMISTAEEFLQSSLNTSETARKLYVHRNTLLYRLDKIEKATGLNLRSFSDAVAFRVLTILRKLLNR